MKIQKAKTGKSIRANDAPNTMGLSKLQAPEAKLASNDRPQMIKNRYNAALEKDTQKRYKRRLAGTRALRAVGNAAKVAGISGLVGGLMTRGESTRAGRMAGKTIGATAGAIGSSALTVGKNKKNYAKDSARAMAGAKRATEKRAQKGKVKF